MRVDCKFEPLQSDAVHNPPHYTGAIDCIDALQACLTAEEFEGLCKGSALQYIWRERSKGGTEDLHKAIWYLSRLVAFREGDE